jgi:hypothetical protein
MSCCVYFKRPKEHDGHGNDQENTMARATTLEPPGGNRVIDLAVPLPDLSVPLPEPEDGFADFRRAELRQRLVAAGVPLIERRADTAELPDQFTERDIYSDLAYAIEVYLRGLSVPQLVCLTYGHRWPELVPGFKVPRGFRVVPAPERRGVFLVTETCTRKVVTGKRKTDTTTCGTGRQSLTLAGELRGLFDRSNGRQYRYDNDVWEKRPEGSRLTRIDFWNEVIRRMGRELFPAETGEDQ